MKKFLLTAVAVAALTATPFIMQQLSSSGPDVTSAQAQESGGKGGQGYRGGGGASGGGSSKGGHEEGESEHESGSKGKGGSGGGEHDDGDEHEGSDGEDHGGKSGSDGGAGRGGGGSSSGSDVTSRGGRPVWAQEGIPEIELGRLNVARSPTHVIDRAFDEVRSEFDPVTSAALYSMTAEQFAVTVRNNWDTVTLVDSPLQNLGLFRDIRQDGTTVLSGVIPASTLDLTAIFLGAASDKTMPISTDTVRALNAITGLPALSDADVSTLATKAETVRQGIQAGHDGNPG